MSKHKLLGIAEWAERNEERIFWIIYALLAASFLSSGMSLGWDDSEYLGFGKYIWGDHGYSAWYRPPVWPTVLGLLWKVGFPMPVTMQIFAAALYLSIPLVSYYLFPGSRKYAGLVLASHPMMFQWSHFSLSHIPASLFVLLALGTRGARSGIFASLAGLSRFTYFIYLPVSLLEKNRVDRLKGAALILVPYFAAIFFLFGNPFFQMEYARVAINEAEFIWFWTKGPLFYVLRLLAFSPLALLALKKRSTATTTFILSALYFQMLPHKEGRFIIDMFVYLAFAFAERFPRLSLAQSAYHLLFIPFLLIYPSISPDVFAGVEDNSTVFGMFPEVNAYRDVTFYKWFNPYNETRWDVDYCMFSENSVPCSSEACAARVSMFRDKCLSWDVLYNQDPFIIARNPE